MIQSETFHLQNDMVSHFFWLNKLAISAMSYVEILEFQFLHWTLIRQCFSVIKSVGCRWDCMWCSEMSQQAACQIHSWLILLTQISSINHKSRLLEVTRTHCFVAAHLTVAEEHWWRFVGTSQWMSMCLLACVFPCLVFCFVFCEWACYTNMEKASRNHGNCQYVEDAAVFPSGDLCNHCCFLSWCTCVYMCM